jgi:hypothetical protein
MRDRLRFLPVLFILGVMLACLFAPDANGGFFRRQREKREARIAARVAAQAGLPIAAVGSDCHDSSVSEVMYRAATVRMVRAPVAAQVVQGSDCHDSAFTPDVDYAPMPSEYNPVGSEGCHSSQYLPATATYTGPGTTRYSRSATTLPGYLAPPPIMQAGPPSAGVLVSEPVNPSATGIEDDLSVIPGG